MLRVNFIKRNNLRQPSFSRMRLKLRAPMQSEPINLEDHQLSYDLYNTYAKLERQQNTMTTDYTTLEEDLTTLRELLNQMAIRMDRL